MKSNTTNETLRRGYIWPVALPKAAKRIGCSPGHLRRVLTGERQGAKIKAEYEALKAEVGV